MKRMAVAMALWGAAGAAMASGDINQVGTLTQGEFLNFSRDLGAVVAYKALTPAESLGVTGFDVGIETNVSNLKYSGLSDQASSGSGYSAMPTAKVHLHKGLPLGLDVGLSYGVVPGSNVTMTGMELRYALVEGGVATPAVGLRASYSQLGGVDQLGMIGRGLEVTVSKGFAMVTPYAGAGQVWTVSTPHNIAGLSEEKFSLARLYVGANFNFGLLNLDVEADRTGDTSGYGVKLGWRF